MGSPTRNAFVDFDPSSGKPHRVGVTLPPDVAAKVIAAAKAMDVSVSWYLGELGRRDTVGDFGLPLWFMQERPAPQLPLSEAETAERLAS